MHELGLKLVADKIRELGGKAREQRAGRQIELVAHGHDPLGREVRIRVLTRTAGDWQTSTSYGQKRTAESVSTAFWVLVDLIGQQPQFYVVPEWWMQNNIHDVHKDYLATNGGRRVVNNDSDHHRITTDRVTHGFEQWDELGIFY
ncbi:MAG: hypothetical protein JWN95_1138 [Frankiales bacterium]|nr:hypothetical protein [Frankiales bacterium]